MAKWVSAADVRVPDYGINEALRTGMAAYEFGSGVKEDIQKRELGEAMAAIPDIQTQKDTEQSAMLAEQTADFGEAIPTSEKMALRSAGRRRIPATRDWKTWEDDILKKAGSLGPEALQAAQAHITKTQQDGFSKAASRAIQLMDTDPQAAARALEEAYSNMPDSNSADVTLAPDGTVMFQSIDEDTGEPEGQPVPVTKEGIADIIQQMQDPVAWAKAVKEGRVASEKAAESKRQFDKKYGLEEKKFALDQLRYEDASPERDAKIKKLQAEIADIYKKGQQAERRLEQTDTQLAQQDAASNRKMRLEEAKQELIASNNPLEQDKLRAEIAKLEADAEYIRGGKGAFDRTKLHAMPHKDLVEQIGKTEEILREAEYEMQGEDPTPDAQRRYQQVKTLLQRLYTEEGRRRGVKGVSNTTAIPTDKPKQVKSIEEAMALPSGTTFIDPNGNPRVRP